MDRATGGSLHHGLRELFGFFYQFLCFFRDYFSRSIRFLEAISNGLSVGWVSRIMLNSWGLGLRVEMHLLKEVLIVNL